LRADGGFLRDGEEFAVTPHGAGALIDFSAGEAGFDFRVIVGDFERAEIEFADVGGREGVFAIALAAFECLHEPGVFIHVMLRNFR
jgi:hypothetical protein